MSIMESVYTRLSGLGSVYYGEAPQSKALPYVVYQVVSGVDMMALDEPTDLINSRIQVDAYATTATEANTLWDSARNLLKGNGADFTCGAITKTGELPELILDGHRVSGDFSLWHDIG